MNKLIVFLLVALTVGCSKEDEINAELGRTKRVYDVNSSDPAIKFVSQFYVEYDKELLFDADSSDWLYNFQRKNEVMISAPDQTPTAIMRGIKIVEEMFLQSYPKEIMKTKFPHNIIIADTIRIKGVWSDSPPIDLNTFASRGFIAIRVGDKDKVFSESEKEALSVEIHKSFLVDYFLTNRAAEINLVEFYRLGTPYYGLSKPSGATTELLYEQGFTKWGGQYANMYPTKLEHAKFWAEFLLTKSEEEIEATIAQYPAMKTNHDAIMASLKNCFKVNIKEVIYKAKK